MCLGVPAEVLSVEGDSAEVNVKGAKQEVRVDLVEVERGDWILNHAGFAIKKISRKEARKTLETFEEFLEED